jgi:HSP20 family protein
VVKQSTAASLAKETTEPGPLRLVRSADLLRKMEELYDSVSRRAFEIFENSGRAVGRDLDNWVQAESEALHPVPVNVSESDKSFTVRAEVPGFKPGELDVSIDGPRLTIAGKRETTEERKDEKTVFREQRSDQVMRLVTLPSAADGNKISAVLKDGILTIEIPKTAAAKHVPIQAETIPAPTEVQERSAGTGPSGSSPEAKSPPPRRTKKRKTEGN